MAERKNRALYTEHKMGSSKSGKKYFREADGLTADQNSPNTDDLRDKKDRQSRKLKKVLVEGIDYPRHFPVFKESIGSIGSYLMYNHFGKEKIELQPEKDEFKSVDDKLNEDDKAKNRKKELIDPNTVLPAPVPPLPTMKTRNRNKGILMNELYGNINKSGEGRPVKVGLNRYKRDK